MENCSTFTQKESSSGLEKEITVCESSKKKGEKYKKYAQKMTNLLKDEIVSQEISNKIIEDVYQWILFHPDASDEEILNKQDDIMIEMINRNNLSHSIADKIIRNLEYKE